MKLLCPKNCEEPYFQVHSCTIPVTEDLRVEDSFWVKVDRILYDEIGYFLENDLIRCDECDAVAKLEK